MSACHDPYRTPALVLNTRRTGAARLRRRVFRAWIAVLVWWRGPTVRLCRATRAMQCPWCALRSEVDALKAYDAAKAGKAVE